MSLPQVLDRCIDKWRGQGVSLSAPISEAEIRRVWKRLDRRLSSDVACLYTTVGGFGQDYGEWDEDFYWILWPWEFLQERNFEERVDGVMFCDHSIEIAVWELRYEDDDHSSVWRAHWNSKVAETLESFFEQYLENPWKLL
jgi:hypothetical protein